jgi:hypothetical protein
VAGGWGEDRAGKTSLADRISPVAQVDEVTATRPLRPVNLANGPRVLLNIVDTGTLTAEL